MLELNISKNNLKNFVIVDALKFASTMTIFFTNLYFEFVPTLQ